VAFYPVLLLALVGIIQRYSEAGQWRSLLLYSHLAWFAMLALHSAWSARFLVFPLTVLLVSAGAGFQYLRYRIPARAATVALAIVVTASLVFSCAYVYLQAGTFSDIKQTALFVNRNRPHGRVYSDEKIKTAYYLPAVVRPYIPGTQHQPGDLIVLHSFYTDLAAEVAALESQYELDYLFRASSATIPLLPVGLLEKSHRTNTVFAVHERFRAQYFRSIVLRVAGIDRKIHSTKLIDATTTR
jgi:hypothetical protein